ncbi:hypothetical protein [Bacillus haynesii]|uniref:hypothetical protein n=3 Tax=Bacillus haynesii TaxID=1925021 RepID=UPI0022809338|nr:hypothetical protein [Bacillus haynesii]MCY8436306.1 hypothetical protein [Bacillus haynesii]MCY8579718.1 hypothetical protein [Bacillus haynesii]MCY9158585.1 hypothetical protein [Bacillus haynesii]MEC0712670.1 hypothetical protein [Bacillus haynesii]
MSINVYFSDFFNIDPRVVEDYGAFDVSLINDFPLFIDPFLLFNSSKEEYQELHKGIIKYLKFLRDKAQARKISEGLLKAWFMFPEIKQNWLGFSKNGNGGNGLGRDFANALYSNLSDVLSNFGEEKVTEGSHLEKLCIIKEKVGKDSISDFTTRLIHEYLLKYTQTFALDHLDKKYVKKVSVNNVRFNYKTETWENDTFQLPFMNEDYVLLSPVDILTKDETWINKADMVKDFSLIPESIDNEQLRFQINNYFMSILPKKPSQKDRSLAVSRVISEFPEFVDYYIKYKEERGEQAEATSIEKVKESVSFYVEKFKSLIALLEKETEFYQTKDDTFEESLKRVNYMKHVIEDNNGYRIFYSKGKPIKKEDDLQILYRLTWFATESDVNREVNNGRGPVDYKVSRGDKDKTLIEFKLASNSQLKRNLQKQVEIYEKANDTKKSIKVILYFSEEELNRVNRILRELELTETENIILIDARNDNKPSASTA